ncbi:hypothetical protein RK09_00185 [Kocuria rhizophila]|nr:hypothetical protein RK09_00185 [Kocuria rhizophila]
MRVTSMTRSSVTTQGPNSHAIVVVSEDTHGAGPGMIPGPAPCVVLAVRADYGVSVQVAIE